MKLNLKNILFNLVFFLFISFFVYSLIFSKVGIVQYRKLVTQVEEQEKELVALDTQIETLKKNIESWQTSDFFLEKVARQELGMVYPNELVYLTQ